MPKLQVLRERVDTSINDWGLLLSPFGTDFSWVVNYLFIVTVNWKMEGVLNWPLGIPPLTQTTAFSHTIATNNCCWCIFSPVLNWKLGPSPMSRAWRITSLSFMRKGKKIWQKAKNWYGVWWKGCDWLAAAGRLDLKWGHGSRGRWAIYAYVIHGTMPKTESGSSVVVWYRNKNMRRWW